MKAFELFKFIKDLDYNTDGDNVDWQVVIYDEDKTIYLVFEESADREDWKNNFRFPWKVYKKQESCMLIAYGWGNAYKSCNDIIMETLKQAIDKKPLYKVCVIGWSYGGAMAQIAAEDINYRYNIFPDVVTFGAPKPFFGAKTREYVASCCSCVTHYGQWNDVVTYCPPLPFYTKNKKTKRIGKKFNLFELFNAEKYHCEYDNEGLYS